MLHWGGTTESYADKGKYIHPHVGGGLSTAGHNFQPPDETKLVVWDGRADFERLAFQLEFHEAHSSVTEGRGRDSPLANGGWDRKRTCGGSRPCSDDQAPEVEHYFRIHHKNYNDSYLHPFICSERSGSTTACVKHPYETSPDYMLPDNTLVVLGRMEHGFYHNFDHTGFRIIANPHETSYSGPHDDCPSGTCSEGPLDPVTQDVEQSAGFILAHFSPSEMWSRESGGAKLGMHVILTPKVTSLTSEPHNGMTLVFRSVWFNRTKDLNGDWVEMPTKEDFLRYGFVMENAAGDVCMPGTPFLLRHRRWGGTEEDPRWGAHRGKYLKAKNGGSSIINEEALVFKTGVGELCESVGFESSSMGGYDGAVWNFQTASTTPPSVIATSDRNETSGVYNVRVTHATGDPTDTVLSHTFSDGNVRNFRLSWKFKVAATQQICVKQYCCGDTSTAIASHCATYEYQPPTRLSNVTSWLEEYFDFNTFGNVNQFSAEYTGKYLLGYAADGGVMHATLSDAKTACVADTTCNGVTVEIGGYTTRTGTQLIASPSAQNSWQRGYGYSVEIQLGEAVNTIEIDEIALRCLNVGRPSFKAYVYPKEAVTPTYDYRDNNAMCGQDKGHILGHYDKCTGSSGAIPASRHDYHLLIKHSTLASMYAQTLVCSKTTGSRTCSKSLTDIADGAPIVFHEYKGAHVVTHDPASVKNDQSAMADLMEEIGLEMIFNQPELMDLQHNMYSYWDDDGSFMLKHATLPYVAEPSGLKNRASAWNVGAVVMDEDEELVWRKCPLNAHGEADCYRGFTRDQFIDRSFILEREGTDTANRDTCLLSSVAVCKFPPDYPSVGSTVRQCIHIDSNDEYFRPALQNHAGGDAHRHNEHTAPSPGALVPLLWNSNATQSPALTAEWVQRPGKHNGGCADAGSTAHGASSGYTWTAVASNVAGSTGTWQTVALSGVGSSADVTALRVWGNSAATAYGISLWEVRVLDGSGATLAPSGASASFEQQTWMGAAMAIDGDETGTRWATDGSPAANDWLLLTFASPGVLPASVQLLWEDAYASSFNIEVGTTTRACEDQSKDVAVDEWYNVYVVGHSSTVADDGLVRAVIAKYNPKDSIGREWIKTLHVADGETYFTSLTIGSNSSYAYVGGYTGTGGTSLSSDMLWYDNGIVLGNRPVQWGNKLFPHGDHGWTHRKGGGLVACYDSNGRIMWLQTLRGNTDSTSGHQDEITGVAIDANDEYLYVVGSTSGNNGGALVASYPPPSHSDPSQVTSFTITDGGSDAKIAYIAKLSALDGSVLWVSTIGATAGTATQNYGVYPGGVALDIHGYAYMVGTTQMNVDTSGAAMTDSLDGFLAKYDVRSNVATTLKWARMQDAYEAKKVVVDSVDRTAYLISQVDSSNGAIDKWNVYTDTAAGAEHMWQKVTSSTLLMGLALDPSRSYIYLAGYDNSLGSSAADQRAITWKMDSDGVATVRAAHEAYDESRQSAMSGVAVDTVSKYVYSVGHVIEAPYATTQPQLQQLDMTSTDALSATVNLATTMAEAIAGTHDGWNRAWTVR